MKGIDVTQLRELVIRPVLLHIGLHSPAAENLLIGTAAQESHSGSYIKQLGKGPAVGIFQMEPATHDDIWNHYLAYKPELSGKIRDLELPDWYQQDEAREMAGNLYYAAAMCRIHYLRVPKPLPAADDVNALAAYWKKYYNTHLGKGTEEEFVHNYQTLVEGRSQ